MPESRTKIAHLDEARLTKLRALEQELGGCIVAVEPGHRFADLPEAKLERLRAAEEELGFVLLAYECD